MFARIGRFRTQLWSTQIVDVRRGQLLDVVPGRDSTEPCRWLAARDEAWRAGIEWATLDLSASYRTVFDTMLPDATQVADPFHVVRLANQALDECRRRVQNETLGHRGRKHDPLWRARRRLTIARERLSSEQHDRVLGLLRAGDPRREVWFAWNAKEVVRQIYDHTDPELAVEWVAEIGRDFIDPEMPLEVRRLGRTITRWADQICRVAPLSRHERTDRSRQQPGKADQAGRLRTDELPTPPRPLPALRRQTRLDPPTHDPTLKRGEPPKQAFPRHAA